MGPTAALRLQAGTGREFIENPLWTEVEAAIRRLDGEEHNDLYLDRPDEQTWLAVGGGAGRYLVMLTLDAQSENESWLVVCREGADEGTETLVVGGQPGRYPATQVVALEAALEAAKAFWETGSPTPSLRWERT